MNNAKLMVQLTLDASYTTAQRIKIVLLESALTHNIVVVAHKKDKERPVQKVLFAHLTRLLGVLAILAL
jgi:hypothetical protein